MDMYCTHCGKELKEDEKFCGRCGTKVEEITNTSEYMKQEYISRPSNISQPEQKNVAQVSSQEVNAKHSRHSDVQNKTIKISFGLWLIIILVVGVIVASLIIALRDNQTNLIDSGTSSKTTQKEVNSVLEVIDETNEEFKINGMELIEAIVNTYDVAGSYRYMNTENGIMQYGISLHILSVRAEISYPAILIGVSEKTNNVVAIGIGDPYDYDGYKNDMLQANYRHVEKALNNLGYSDLWNSISLIKSSCETNQSEKYFYSGVNGVFYTYAQGYENGKYGINYVMYKAKKNNTTSNQNTSTTVENTNTLSQENTTTSKEKSNIKLDINKFIEELSYKSMSTVHDGIHGGDGYRQDYEFYNSDLSINNFKVTTQNNEKKYVLETNGNLEHKYKFVLTIILGQDNKLNEINITCTPPTLQAKGILNCALEVEEALGYTVFNKRNYQNEEQLEKTLKSKSYIETQGKYNILVDNIIEKIENTETGEKSVFILDNGKLTYTISFDDV